LRIELALNQHFKSLMGYHGLVASLRLDEDFKINLLDRDNQPIGRHSISHGMRQLAATGLLWALKDVSKAGLPVIVDTPLARIDRGNQQNLLTRYYPHAAEQVILLATDSEMNDEKFEAIRGSVYRQCRLDNDTGDDSRFVYETIYE